ELRDAGGGERAADRRQRPRLRHLLGPPPVRLRAELTPPSSRPARDCTAQPRRHAHGFSARHRRGRHVSSRQARRPDGRASARQERCSLQYGLFAMPSHPPERSLYDGQQWDLQVIRWADELGFAEAWIGEHHTAIWEPNPSPDLLVAQALVQTRRIKLGPGGFLLPYHHPAELANRAAMLDHLAQGRFLLGIAASGLDSDFALFHVDGNAGVNRAMTRESLDIILRLWTEEEPFDYQGTFWSVSRTGPMHSMLGPHITPFQKPHPPIGVSGISPNSETLRLAGERGFLPMSPSPNADLMAPHWPSTAARARRAWRAPSGSAMRTARRVEAAP